MLEYNIKSFNKYYKDNIVNKYLNKYKILSISRKKIQNYFYIATKKLTPTNQIMRKLNFDRNKESNNIRDQAMVST